MHGQRTERKKGSALKEKELSRELVGFLVDFVAVVLFFPGQRKRPSRCKTNKMTVTTSHIKQNS